MPEDSSTEKLAADLRALIAPLQPGTRLPSSRELVGRYGVSPVTVSRAVSTLVNEGRVVVRPGAGTYVAAGQPQSGTSADMSW
ncbi:MAG: winged helix-turn-helix transcriptional regulator, partial [Solirubrobacterales bacterium]|nr:winged helix-turn-helix transcriptional regulator [Solirubrobacterales bacterium]